jgi:hypothetical protein
MKSNYFLSLLVLRDENAFFQPQYCLNYCSVCVFEVPPFLVDEKELREQFETEFYESYFLLPKPLIEEKAEKMFKTELKLWYDKYMKLKDIEQHPSMYKKVQTYSNDSNTDTSMFQSDESHDPEINLRTIELSIEDSIECAKKDLPWDNEKMELELTVKANTIGKTIRKKDKSGQDYFEEYKQFMTITEALSELRRGVFVKDKDWFKEFEIKMHLKQGEDMSMFLGLIDPRSAADNRPEKFKEITRLNSMVKKQQSKVLRIEEEIHREDYLSKPQKKLFNTLEYENKKLVRLTSELYFSRYNITDE